MNEIIKPLPDIPKKLRDDAQRGVVIPFIGAGASRIAGCPGWDDFADQALHFIIEQGKLNYGQLAQIKHLNPRIKLSIARSIAAEHGFSIDFREILSPPNKGYENSKGCRLYGSLSKLSKTFITTNYDEWLDVVPVALGVQIEPGTGSTSIPAIQKREVIYQVQDFTPANLEKANTVIHLHGSVSDPDNMVMTTRDYIRHYANDRHGEENYVLTFLEHLFREKTVLFVGYGLDELEILEYVIQKAKASLHKGGQTIDHFILQGFFSHEADLMKSLERYYLDECGIQIIPFLLDQKGWDQTLEVLDDFVKQMPAGDPLVLQKQITMGTLLDD